MIILIANRLFKECLAFNSVLMELLKFIEPISVFIAIFSKFEIKLSENAFNGR